MSIAFRVSIPGMSETPLDLHRLPGIGPMRQTRLAEAGITTVEALLAADVDALAALPGFNRSIVERAQDAVRAMLDATPSGPAANPPEVPDVPGLDAPEAAAEPAPEAPQSEKDKRGGRRKRGLDAARRIEKTLEWVHRSREHARGARRRDRKRTRKQLKRLSAALEAVQQQVIRDGVTSEAATHLEELLSELERRLKRFAKRTLGRRRMRKVRRVARQARQAFDEGLD